MIKYEALLSAVEYGTIARAAEHMGYTTSGISRMISSVEEELGVILLVRKKSGVTPTQECLALLPHFRDLLKAHNDLNQTAAELKGLIIGNITVGTSMEAYISPLADIVGEFNKIYPGINVNVIEDYSSVLAAKLQSGNVDFCVMSKRPGQFQWIKLKDDPLVVITSENHRFSELDGVTLQMIQEETVIDIPNSIESDNAIMLRKNGIDIPRVLSCSNNFAAASMTEAGLGIALENQANARVWNKNLQVIPIVPPQYVEIGIGIPENNNISPAAGRFIDFALDQMS